jgi:hypothetical protein
MIKKLPEAYLESEVRKTQACWMYAMTVANRGPNKPCITFESVEAK